MGLAHWFGRRATGREWLRGALGGMLGVAITALVCRFFGSDDSAMPWLVAPMGATAVLLFEMPASPLSQPWPVIGGHMISAALGLWINLVLGGGPLAVGLSVGIAIAAMSLLRCLHPPAGGTAALMTIGGPAIARAGWSFLLTPIGANAVLLLALTFAFHRLTGHSYPHHAVADLPPGRYAMADIEAVLADWDEVLDISAEDLAMLVRTLDERAGAGGSPPR